MSDREVHHWVEQGGKVISTVAGTRGTRQTDQKGEVMRSSLDSSRSKLILARPSVLACRVVRGIAHAVRSVPSSGRGFGLRSIPDVRGSSR